MLEKVFYVVMFAIIITLLFYRIAFANVFVIESEFGPLIIENTESESLFIPEQYKQEVVNGIITHYCVCFTCCGKTTGETASGIFIENGMEDPYIASCGWLNFGSIVEINGQQYTIQDRGGNVKEIGKIDLFVPEGHDECIRRGVIKTEIKIIYRA